MNLFYAKINKSSKILILSESDLYGEQALPDIIHQSLRNKGFKSLMLVNHKISKTQQLFKIRILIENG